jgi:hypothetical protein
MTIKLEEEIIELLNSKDTVKVLATLNRDNIPHVAFKEFLDVNADGNILYLELIESSQTNSNMVNSIWFKRKVAINIKSQDGRSYQIKGTPIRALISGPIFENYYKLVSEKIEDGDLSTVWIIRPEEVINETYEIRKREEEEKHPLLKHVDRLAKIDI